MSQHLINDFIHRTTIFKPLTGEKIINKKLVKYQASNRKNNTSPQDIEESVHEIKTNKVHSEVKVEALSKIDSKTKREIQYKHNKDEEAEHDENHQPAEHIDIIV